MGSGSGGVNGRTSTTRASSGGAEESKADLRLDQILDLHHIHDRRPPRPAHHPPLRRSASLPNLHLPPRCSRPSRRSHPALTANFQEPRRALMQGFPLQCPGELAGR